MVLCASRQYIMSHVVIPPELLKGGGTFSSIFVVPPPESLRHGTILKGGGSHPLGKIQWGGTHLFLHLLYTLLYIYIYTYFFYKSIHGINFDSWL